MLTLQNGRERERAGGAMAVLPLPHLPYPDIVLSLLVLVGGPLLYYLLWQCVVLGMWWQPRRTQLMLEAQGIKCLPRRPFLHHGNFHEFVAINAHARSKPMPQFSHDITSRMLPHLYQWSRSYGKPFVYWFGSQAHFILTDPEQAKAVLSNKFGHFKKPSGRPEGKDLGGMGLGMLEGEKWAQHRRIISPAFFLDKLKGMAPTMVACADAVIKTWETQVERKEEIDVFQEFRILTADIIAHTAFGSSYAEGKLVFELQHKQQALFSKIINTVYIPGSRYFPSAQNRYRKELKTRIAETLSRVIESRLKSCKTSGGDMYGNDLLGLMLAANRGELHGNQRSLTMGIDELIDECKTFFFAGHETTTTLLTFMFLLLGSSPEWQERLREEVYKVCGKADLPTAESLNHLKLVGMVMNETLRLYPPGLVLTREAVTDIQLGMLLIPARTILEIPVIAWHHDERYWGPDVSEFRPERFEDGVLNACKVTGAYMPFSIGPRHCVGHMFATMEAKLIVSTILQRYRFRLSPRYIHAPTIAITLQPQFGMPIIFEKLV